MYNFFILFLFFYFIFKSNETNLNNDDSYIHLEETLKDIDG